MGGSVGQAISNVGTTISNAGGNLVNATQSFLRTPGDALKEGARHLGQEMNRNPVTQVLGAGTGIGIPLMAAEGSGLLGGHDDNAQMPPNDPRLAELQKHQMDLAGQFEQNMPGYQEQLGNQAERTAGNWMEKQGKQAAENYNSRGLLYSGMQQGAQADIAGQGNAAVSQQKMNINKGLHDQLNAMYDQAAQMGAQNYQMQLQQEDDLYSRALQNVQSNIGDINSLLTAGGMLGGAAIAKGKAK